MTPGKRTAKKAIGHRSAFQREALYEESLSPCFVEDARRLVEEALDNQTLGSTDGDRIQRWFENQMDRVAVLSREQQVAQVQVAYTWFAFKAGTPDFSEWINSLRNHLKIKNRRNQDPLSIVVRSVLYYSDISSEGEKVSERNTHRVSRNVAAIRCLIEDEILPSQMLALSKRKGQGLDEWARVHANYSKGREGQGKESRSKPGKSTRKANNRSGALSIALAYESNDLQNHHFSTPRAIAIVEAALERAKISENNTLARSTSVNSEF